MPRFRGKSRASRIVPQGGVAEILRFAVSREEGCRNKKEIRPVILSVIFTLWTDILFGSEFMFLHGSDEIFRRQQRFSPKTAVCFRKSFISMQLEYGSCIRVRRPGPTETFRIFYAKHTLFDGKSGLWISLCARRRKVISRWYIRYNLQKKTGSQFWLTESRRICKWWSIGDLNSWPPHCQCGALANWANTPIKMLH